MASQSKLKAPGGGADKLMELLLTLGIIIAIYFTFLYWQIMLVFLGWLLFFGGIIWLAIMFPFLWVVYVIIIGYKMLNSFSN